jgi:hypothetical protein
LVLFFGGIGYAVYSSTKIDPNWTRINGTVVGVSTLQNNTANNHSTSYEPIVSYTVKGQTNKVTSNVGSSWYPQTGSQQQIAYNSTQPADAKVVISATTRRFVLVFPAIGLLMIVGAAVLFVLNRGRNQDDMSPPAMPASPIMSPNPTAAD